MKIALLITGQARHPDIVEIHDGTIQKTFSHLKPDVYCAMWDEPAARRALEIFQPKKHILVTDNIEELRSDFWTRYTRRVSPEIAASREAIFNYKIIREFRGTVVSRDNGLRQWFLWKRAIEMIDDNYDCVIVARPDIVLERFTIKMPSQGIILKDVKKSAIPNASIDHIFAGSPQDMRIFLTVDLPTVVAIGETAGKNGRAVSYLKGNKWLYVEIMMIYVLNVNNLAIDRMAFDTTVVRKYHQTPNVFDNPVHFTYGRKVNK